VITDTEYKAIPKITVSFFISFCII